MEREKGEKKGAAHHMHEVKKLKQVNMGRKEMEKIGIGT